MSVLEWLEASTVAAEVRRSAWLYPALQVGHLLSMAALVGTGLLLDLRLLGWTQLPLPRLLRVTQPLLLTAAAIAVLTGGLMFSAEATGLVAHPAFQAKLVLLGALLGNAIGFHLGVGAALGTWADDPRPPAAARLAGGVAVVGWVAVVATARLIAFL